MSLPLAAACLQVGVVGAGRAGAVMGAALRAAGHEVVGVSAVSDASRARAALLLPGVPVLPPDEVAHGAELVVLAVPDDSLGFVVRGLADLGAFHEGQLVAHLSGRCGLAVLAPALGTLPLALHPVLPFSGTATDLDLVRGAAFGVTAPDALRGMAEALVTGLGGVPVWVSEELRPLWHAALCHGANHLVTLVATAADLLRAAGADDPGLVLKPLLEAALAGALSHGDGALTGPVSRGDVGTVASHLEVIPDAVRPAYLALARLTADRALASGRLDARAADDVQGVLK